MTPVPALLGVLLLARTASATPLDGCLALDELAALGGVTWTFAGSSTPSNVQVNAFHDPTPGCAPTIAEPHSLFQLEGTTQLASVLDWLLVTVTPATIGSVCGRTQLDLALFRDTGMSLTAVVVDSGVACGQDTPWPHPSSKDFPSPAPVPEPWSVVTVGSGLALLRRRTR